MLNKVEVTQDDIDNGIPNNCCSCPVALALENSLGLRFGAATRHYLSAGNGAGSKHNYTWPVPENVAKFMSCYDRGIDVAPFSFELEVPDVD